MGDWFQRLAAPDVRRSDANAAAARVRACLQPERIISAEPSDCTLGSTGYRPGPEWHKAVAPAQRLAAGFLRLAVNGLEIVAAPVVHYTIDPDPFEAICPACGARCSSDFVEAGLLAHVAAWQRGDDSIGVACPHCAGRADLLAWRVNHMVLAHLGLVFWNWPPLADRLIAGVARLAGSHIVTLSGKL